jgi:predicted transcriptional regulator
VVGRRVPRNFRLDPETNKRLALLAAKLKTTQTEALEVAVQDFFFRTGGASPGDEVAEEVAAAAASVPDEAIARQWDAVADSFEADENLSQELRDAVSRVARNTAKKLRS